jgi:hypothetical protein
MGVSVRDSGSQTPTAREKPMVEYSVRWEIVNGMYAARRRGHGCVRPFLKSRGVAPASGYRWKKEQEWLLEEGPPARPA